MAVATIFKQSSLFVSFSKLLFTLESDFAANLVVISSLERNMFKQQFQYGSLGQTRYRTIHSAYLIRKMFISSLPCCHISQSLGEKQALPRKCVCWPSRISAHQAGTQILRIWSRFEPIGGGATVKFSSGLASRAICK